MFQIVVRIVYGNADQLIYPALGVVVIFISIRILNDWRDGFRIFLIWLLVEDLIRKYMGNNMAIYFGKDFLVGISYISFVVALRKHAVKTFRPPFLISLGAFAWFAIAQVFNSNSPSLVYGLLGIKLYLFYIPLMFLGYAIIEKEEDLSRFLVLNMIIAGVIALLGIVQSIVGLSFLNPSELADDIKDLGSLTRVAPISGMLVSRPTSVFVSDGRFASYMVLMFIVGLGTAGYLLLRGRRGQSLVFISIGLTALGGVMSGSRGAFLYIVISAMLVCAAMLWGAPWRWRQGHRLVKAIRRSLMLISVAIALIVVFFPDAILARWAFYTETMSPDSAAYELDYRVWDNPYANLKGAFDNPHWVTGNGIGTASLGVQYVARIMGVPPNYVGVESGYGVVIVELGLLGIILWVLWTLHVTLSAFKVAQKLKETPYFPVAASIVWFTFMLLILDTFSGMQSFENYVNNAYLWLLLGILFRLPSLASEYRSASIAAPSAISHAS